jgi:hypothetical protein
MRKYSYEELEKRKHCRILTRQYVKEGFIKRLYRCEFCNKISDKLEAHHFNYSDPLFVTWLCKICHSAIHRLNPHLKSLWKDRE